MAGGVSGCFDVGTALLHRQYEHAGFYFTPVFTIPTKKRKADSMKFDLFAIDTAGKQMPYGCDKVKFLLSQYPDLTKAKSTSLMMGSPSSFPVPCRCFLLIHSWSKFLLPPVAEWKVRTTAWIDGSIDFEVEGYVPAAGGEFVVHEGLRIQQVRPEVGAAVQRCSDHTHYPLLLFFLRRNASRSRAWAQRCARQPQKTRSGGVWTRLSSSSRRCCRGCR